jgi:hypothetical protein
MFISSAVAWISQSNYTYKTKSRQIDALRINENPELSRTRCSTTIIIL